MSRWVPSAHVHHCCVLYQSRGQRVGGRLLRLSSLALVCGTMPESSCQHRPQTPQTPQTPDTTDLSCHTCPQHISGMASALPLGENTKYVAADNRGVLLSTFLFCILRIIASNADCHSLCNERAKHFVRSISI